MRGRVFSLIVRGRLFSLIVRGLAIFSNSAW